MQNKESSSEVLKNLVGENGHAAIVGATENGKAIFVTFGQPIFIQGLLDHFKRFLWMQTADRHLKEAKKSEDNNEKK